MNFHFLTAFLVLAAAATGGCGVREGGMEKTVKAENKPSTGAYKKLTSEEERIIVHKGTEPPFSGKFYKFSEDGTYLCKRCGAPLYRSDDKFDSGCGWPSFDAEIKGAVRRNPDPDGSRVEITCARCGAHLGHVFEGEGFTPKDIRHCVNSLSLDFEARKLDFQPAESSSTLRKAWFAGGCFWGVEHLLKDREGVRDVRSGYMGGRTKNPGYKEVCSGTTGHLETVEVEFDEAKISYEELAKLFFEIHDPTQADGQGPDLGEQYHSAIFYADEAQKAAVEKLIAVLKGKGYKVVTQVRKADTFWPAEDYHQDYYEKTGKTPYCHAWTKRF
jgi:peptide methionine sulfoxide reductase msrA/msrB